MKQPITVAKMSDIPPGAMKCVHVGDYRIAIYNVDGEFFATDDICSHAHASLSEGHLSGCEVSCPLHFATFDVRTGACTGGPAFEDVRSFPIHVVGDDVQIDIG